MPFHLSRSRVGVTEGAADCYTDKGICLAVEKHLINDTATFAYFTRDADVDVNPYHHRGTMFTSSK